MVSSLQFALLSEPSSVESCTQNRKFITTHAACLVVNPVVTINLNTHGDVGFFAPNGLSNENLTKHTA